MASPFAFQLGTNHCPSDEEVLKIRAHLVQPIHRLKRLDDEIADLQRAIDKLADERETLGVYVEAHKALISPVRRLPLDIIQEIFMACLPTHRNCVMSASEAPVLLGRICSAWRAISLSTPPLWASLHIVEPMHSSGSEEPSTLIKEKMEQRLETTKTWLGRSGQCPLSISLESCPNNAFDDRRRPHPGYFLRALIPFASRWQHISFTAQPTSLNAMSLLAETDVPMLETIAIYHHSSRNVKLENFGMLRSSRISSFSISGLNFRKACRFDGTS
ncbi:hypothetical protein B0H13DRAFT_2468593 [Mycena leptocephala]|nr:hypothetical protein B0H13DRAFT_2468593 [Mycena leptocephala]